MAHADFLPLGNMEPQTTDILCALCAEFSQTLAQTGEKEHGGQDTFRLPDGGRIDKAEWLDSMTRWEGVFKHHNSLAELVSSAQTCLLCRLLHSDFATLAGSEAQMPYYCSGWLGLYINGTAAYTEISGGLPAAQDVFRAGFSESLDRMPPRKAPDNNPALTFRLCYRGDTCQLRGECIRGGTPRRIPADGTSPAVFDMARRWLLECVEKHQKCRERAKSSVAESPRTETPPLPTRVLDVSPDLGDMVKLYETQGERDEYVALSHCWGGDIPNKTIRSTFDVMQRGIPISQLPKNFQDAVLITRKLHIRYLWIDALCIIQDEAADWMHEADLMDEVYAWSTVTITGLDSPATTAGILRPERLASVDIPNTRFAIQACADQMLLTLGKCNLSKRAWCLQERFLAPRLLHFGRDQIFWECREALAAEDDKPWEFVGTEQIVRDLIACHRALGEIPPPPPKISMLWCLLIEEYSLRSLTFGKDKLPAMLGMSQMFATKFPGLGRYVAGLWSGDFVRELCWGPKLLNVKQDRQRPGYISNDACAVFSRPEQAIAPSWSWAAVNGALYFPCSRSFRTSWDSEIEVLNVRLSEKGSEGTLVLRGKVIASQYEETEQSGTGLLFTRRAEDSQQRTCIATCVLDFDRHFPRSCYALLVATIGRDGALKGATFASYVVLEKVTGSSSFRRIGVSTCFSPAHFAKEKTDLIERCETQELSIE